MIGEVTWTAPEKKRKITMTSRNIRQPLRTASVSPITTVISDAVLSVLTKPDIGKVPLSYAEPTSSVSTPATRKKLSYVDIC